MNRPKHILQIEKYCRVLRVLSDFIVLRTFGEIKLCGNGTNNISNTTLP